MSQWKIEGVSRHSRQAKTLTVEAQSEREATEKALLEGMEVHRVERAAMPPPSAAVATKAEVGDALRLHPVRTIAAGVFLALFLWSGTFGTLASLVLIPHVSESERMVYIVFTLASLLVMTIVARNVFRGLNRA